MAMSLDGKLFIYSPSRRLAAFQSGVRTSSSPDQEQNSVPRGHVVFVPGLTDGLLALAYLPALAVAMGRLGCSLVQPVLSSSYKGYGTSSLRQDVEELDELFAHLLNDSQEQFDSSPRPQHIPPVPTNTNTNSSIISSSSSNYHTKGNVIVIGHSTGCQDAVFYMKHGKPELRARVSGVVLQAPVSDREWRESLPDTEEFVRYARVSTGAAEVAAAGSASGENQAEGAEQLMPSVAEPDAPITVSRYLSLSAKEGDDDMFSSDLSAKERQSRLGHMASVPTLAVLSAADEYVPRGSGGVLPEGGVPGQEFVSSSIPGGQREEGRDSRSPEVLAENLRRVLMPGSESRTCGVEGSTNMFSGGGSCSKVYVIDGANHALGDEMHAREFVAEVTMFVAQLLGVSDAVDIY